MKTTREDILVASLNLFAERGFDAVSTSMIATSIGITKGALYRHFTSKQEIFESIIQRMFELDEQRSNEDHVPSKKIEDDPSSYSQTSLVDFCEFVNNQFVFWTEDTFASAFRRMITIEQYKSAEMNKLYQDVITSGPVNYTTDLLSEMIKNNQLNDKAKELGAYNLAIQLFAPLKLMLEMADGGCDTDKLKCSLRTLTKEFENNWIKKKMSKCIIRLEKPTEHRFVENLVRESFWNVYRPGCLEHYVLNQLRNDPNFVTELNFVMELDGEIIGQNMFMKAIITTDKGTILPIMTMGPISIAPKFKRQGFGKILLDYTIAKAKELGCGAICMEGNIDFYGKSGFVHASNYGIRYHGLPPDADSSFFLCKELIPGYLSDLTGEYKTPQGYFVDETKAEEFDHNFPPKKKLKLPGQIFE